MEILTRERGGEILTAKEELLQIRKLDKMLKATEQSIDECRRDIYSIQATDYSKDRVSGGQGADIGDRVVKLMLLQDAYNREWDELMSKRAYIRKRIDKVEDLELRALLIHYYVLQHTWEQVAVDMGYSWKHIHRKHSEALIEYAAKNKIE